MWICCTFRVGEIGAACPEPPSRAANRLTRPMGPRSRPSQCLPCPCMCGACNTQAASLAKLLYDGNVFIKIGWVIAS